MELLDPGSIRIYETNLSHKTENITPMEKLTPEISINEEEEEIAFDQSTTDEFYTRIYELADQIQKECGKDELIDPSSDKEGGTSDKGNDSVIDNEEAMKIMKGLEKIRQLDSRLSDLMKKEKDVKKRRGTSAEGSEVGVSISDVSFGSVPLFVTQPREKEDLTVECLETTSIEDGNESNVQSDNSKSRKSKEELHFVERNKELASEGTGIVMTERERERLEQLLEEDDNDNHGFILNQTDLNRLATIDYELEQIIPSSRIDTLSRMTNESLSSKLGEKVLIPLQEEREESTRLSEINKQLKLLKEEEEENEIVLDHEQLEYLIEQCKLEQQQQQQQPIIT